MENYRKGKNVEEELSKEHIPIEMIPENFLWMHVKGGTKVSNVVDFAEKAFKSGEYRSVVWSGCGGGVPKTISCAEIMKRNLKELNQVTRLAYQKIEEYWDPLLSGLDQIVVTRRIAAVHILLTLDQIDPKANGYQQTNVPTKFWPVPKKHENDDYVFRNKRSNNFRGVSQQNRQKTKFQKGQGEGSKSNR
ncbi:hypothetical protein ACKWTF_004964 [Chironomus riparius]